MLEIPHNPLILVDGSSYLFRAYHALPALRTSKGEPTGAIYGVINMLRKLMTTYQPTRMAIIFDTGGKTFRHKLYDAYKSNRAKMPADLVQQIAPLHMIIHAMGLPLLAIPGVEADDVIGTLSAQANKQGLFTLISTCDKDMAQLVNDNVVLLNTMTNVIMDVDGVSEKFLVKPDKIIDYLSLIGDTVDNVPGVPNVGPKTAVKLLKNYGSLNGVSANSNIIQGRVGKSLRGVLAVLPMYKKLVTIDINVDLDYVPEELIVVASDKVRLKVLFGKLEFKQWKKEFYLENVQSIRAKEARYFTILEKTDCIKWMNKLKAVPLFVFDIKTTCLDYMKAEIVGVSFSLTPGEAVYIPVAHDYEGAPSQLDREWVLQQLKPLLEDPNQIKVGHNIKFNLEILANYGVYPNACLYDTMLGSYVLDSTGRPHNIDIVAKKYLNYTVISFDEIAGKGAKQKSFNKVSLEEAALYAAEGSNICLQLHHIFSLKLAVEPKLKSVYEQIEVPLIPVLMSMERHGVLIDKNALFKYSQLIHLRLELLEEQVYALVQITFNLNSTKQLREVLFDKLGLPILKKTPEGHPSTAEAVLQELSGDFPLAKLLLKYRSLSKLKSTYTDKLPVHVNAKTGRVHTSYHQAVTVTGRLSSANPNLQNIPVQKEDEKNIRATFIALPGYQIVSADYSQIELRIMAHLSKDDALIVACQSGIDVHRATAAEVFSISLESVSDKQRRQAKAINFGLIYGMSAFGLSKQLGITMAEAEFYINTYFERFIKVKQFMETTRQQAAEQGYVETLFGRRLYVPNIHSKNIRLRKAAERAAINAPMQGGQADIIKKAMICIHQWIQDCEHDIYMVMQIHDELVFEVPSAHLEVVKPILSKLMTEIVELTVDLVVKIGEGENWEEAHC